jgi:uncharacterized protein
MKTCPTCNRVYDDETFSFCTEDGILLSEWLDEEETLIKPKKFSFDSHPTAIIDESVVAINIAQQFPNVKNADDLYNYTRGFWRLRKERAEKAQYAFAVYKGLIKEVYLINKWELATEHLSEFWEKKLSHQEKNLSIERIKGRYQFYGELAPNIVRNKYLGKLIPLPHGQNPIRYFNC